MSDTTRDTGERGSSTNDLLAAQERKGYGEDEGERGEALDDEAAGVDEQ